MASIPFPSSWHVVAGSKMRFKLSLLGATVGTMWATSSSHLQHGSRCAETGLGLRMLLIADSVHHLFFRVIPAAFVSCLFFCLTHTHTSPVAHFQSGPATFESRCEKLSDFLDDQTMVGFWPSLYFDSATCEYCRPTSLQIAN